MESVFKKRGRETDEKWTTVGKEEQMNEPVAYLNLFYAFKEEKQPQIITCWGETTRFSYLPCEHRARLSTTYRDGK